MKRKSHARARRHFLAAAKHHRAYYGQLARDRMGYALPPRPEVSGAGARTGLQTHELVKVISLLVGANNRALLPAFFAAALKLLKTAEEMAALSQMAYTLGHPNIGVRMAKHAAERGHDLGELAYPYKLLPPYKLLSGNVERALVHGVIRQESEFNAIAISRSGARGLMQLMPGTARLMARAHKQRYRRTKLTKDPRYNLKLGTAYLARLLDRFKGSYILTAAGYNAGPGRAKQWLERYGDPRRGMIDPIDWVESIPFNETRDYVQKVLENTQIYRAQFNRNKTSTINRDLARGKLPAATKLCQAAAASKRPRKPVTC